MAELGTVVQSDENDDAEKGVPEDMEGRVVLESRYGVGSIRNGPGSAVVLLSSSRLRLRRRTIGGLPFAARNNRRAARVSWPSFAGSRRSRH